ncbi:MAG TPA: sulfite exporter TauE/SafE family protein [Prolixibacteraceae bacterium]|nr:sulfite exporter TauE/SafE family protein [Prolixibacteraceae bacterium]
MEEFLKILVFFFSGTVAGFINIMAGGGSMLTIGAMILMGVEPVVANASNRLGVLTGTVSGALTYRSEKFTDLKTSLILSACAIPGAIVGSLFSIQISNHWFQKILSVVMILILITLFLPKKKKAEGVKNLQKNGLIYPVMCLIGFYGGFIQIGVGFILMAAFRHLMAYDLLRVNLHKTFVVLLYTVPVLIIFGMSGTIQWVYALAISLGNALGSFLSVKVALRKGEKAVKIVLAISIFLMALKFFFD